MGTDNFSKNLIKFFIIRPFVFLYHEINFRQIIDEPMKRRVLTSKFEYVERVDPDISMGYDHVKNRNKGSQSITLLKIVLMPFLALLTVIQYTQKHFKRIFWRKLVLFFGLFLSTES